MDFKEILGEAYSPEVEQRLKQAVGKDFVSRADFNEKNEALKTANSTIAERDNQLKELAKSAKGNEELTSKIAELTELNTKTKAEYEAKFDEERKQRILDTELLKHNPVNLKALKAVLDLSKLKFEGEDKLEGLTEQLDGFKKDNDLKALFKTAVPNLRAGADSGAGKTGGQKDTLESIISDRVSQQIKN